MKQNKLRWIIAFLVFIILAESIVLFTLLTPSYAETKERSSVALDTNSKIHVQLYPEPACFQLNLSFLNLEEHTVRWNYGGTLEMWKNDDWYVLERTGRSNALPRVFIEPGKEEGAFYDWEDEYGELRPGKYRFIPNLTRIVDGAANQQIFIAVEFEIE